MLSLVCGLGCAYAIDVLKPCVFSRIAAIIGIVISDRYSSSPVTNTMCGARGDGCVPAEAAARAATSASSAER